MKRRAVLILMVVVAAIVAVIYTTMNRPPVAELGLNGQVLEILDTGGCLSCHSSDFELPFYANFPVAGDLVRKDVEEGYRAYDITPLMSALSNGTEPSPVDVAKVEKVAQDKRMPMAKYYLVHWGKPRAE